MSSGRRWPCGLPPSLSCWRRWSPPASVWCCCDGVDPGRPRRCGMRRDAQAVLLLAVGLALGKLSLTGAALRYVRPWMLPVLGVTAAVLIGLAGVTLWRSLRPAGD